MGLAEQTYVSCSRMWIPKAKTEEPRILGEEKQKDDRVESDSISPPVPIAIASWGCVSGPCILQLSSGISYSPVLYSESRTQPFTWVLGLPEESVSNGHSPHGKISATGKGQAIYRPTADVSNTSLKFQPLPVEVLNCGGENSLDCCA